MEAYSVEDKGKISFHVFVFNVQPNVEINYATGDSNISSGNNASNDDSGADTTTTTIIYVVNRNTKTFHLPTCNSVSQMKASNRVEVKGSSKNKTSLRDGLISDGYSPCQRCHP